MKRFLLLACLLFCFFLFPMTVSAAPEDTSVHIQAIVNSDSSCQISLTATLVPSSNNLSFPIPRSATSVTLNGSPVRTRQSEDARIVDLSGLYGNVTSAISFTLRYTLPDVIAWTDSGALELRLPLLSGFSQPVHALHFSLTLPGDVAQKPAFQSGYHQSNIEKDIVYTTEGATVTGHTTTALIDRETLLLRLPVSESLFPQPILEIFTSDIDSIGIGVCAILAMLYWLWKLRCLPPRRKSATLPPEGSNAGLFGTILGLQTANLNLMVFSWAQLGYLSIHPRRDRVLLVKQMDMGNERNEFERRCFHILFSKGVQVDCSGYRYGMQCQKVSHMPPPTGHLVDKRCGNRKIFRALTAACGLFAGLGLGLRLGSGGILQPLFAVLFAVFGCYTACQIQNWAGCLFLSNRHQLFISTLLSLSWLLLSFFANRFLWGFIFIVLEFVAGLLHYYGGQRTPEGRQAVSQLLGFRRYLKRVSRTTLDGLSRRNPDYFFDLAPYAIALGVGKSFAHQFGAKPFRECHWLDAPLKDTIPAAKWNSIMEDTLKKMEVPHRRASLHRLSRRVGRMIK